MCLHSLSHLFFEISYNIKKLSIRHRIISSFFSDITPRLSIKRKHNPLTVICNIRSKKISLLPVGQTAKPPAIIVFVQHLDDVTAAYGELIGPISSVVVEWDDLEEDHEAGETACVGGWEVCMWLSPKLEGTLTVCWTDAASVSSWMPEEMWSGRVWWETQWTYQCSTARLVEGLLTDNNSPTAVWRRKLLSDAARLDWSHLKSQQTESRCEHVILNCSTVHRREITYEHRWKS